MPQRLVPHSDRAASEVDEVWRRLNPTQYVTSARRGVARAAGRGRAALPGPGRCPGEALRRRRRTGGHACGGVAASGTSVDLRRHTYSRQLAGHPVDLPSRAARPDHRDSTSGPLRRALLSHGNVGHKPSCCEARRSAAVALDVTAALGLAAAPASSSWGRWRSCRSCPGRHGRCRRLPEPDRARRVRSSRESSAQRP